MQNQCLIILGLCLTLSASLVKSCVKPPEVFHQAVNKCQADSKLTQDELAEHAESSDPIFTEFIHCVYQGAGYLKNNKLSIEILEKIFKNDPSANDQEFQKKVAAYLKQTAEVMAEANQQSDSARIALDFFKRSRSEEYRRYFDQVWCLD